MEIYNAVEEMDGDDEVCLYMFFWNGNGYVVLQYREKIFHFVVRVSDANTISCCRKKILKHRGRLLDTE